MNIKKKINKNKKNKKSDVVENNIKTIRVAGVTFNNDDGTSRQKILAKCLANGKTNAKFIKYNYDGEKAIRIITDYGIIGNIPREEIQNILKKVDLMKDINLDIKVFKNENNKKTFFCDVIITYAKNREEITFKKIESKSKVFTAKLIKECSDIDCNNIIDYSIKVKDLNKDDLYNGLSNKEIRDMYSKVYECNDFVFTCSILNNENDKHYEVYYKENDMKIYLGYVPITCNNDIADIINNKKIINGGVLFTGGRYKEYDYNDKEISGMDEYTITLRIRFE